MRKPSIVYVGIKIAKYSAQKYDVTAKGKRMMRQTNEYGGAAPKQTHGPGLGHSLD